MFSTVKHFVEYPALSVQFVTHSHDRLQSYSLRYPFKIKVYMIQMNNSFKCPRL